MDLEPEITEPQLIKQVHILFCEAALWLWRVRESPGTSARHISGIHLKMAPGCSTQYELPFNYSGRQPCKRSQSRANVTPVTLQCRHNDGVKPETTVIKMRATFDSMSWRKEIVPANVPQSHLVARCIFLQHRNAVMYIELLIPHA